MEESLLQTDAVRPPTAGERTEAELSDDERAVAAARAERLVAATLDLARDRRPIPER